MNDKMNKSHYMPCGKEGVGLYTNIKLFSYSYLSEMPNLKLRFMSIFASSAMDVFS